MEAILSKHKQRISQFVAVPSGGGRFEVSIDGKLVFSKLKEKRFPKPEEILEQLK
jgi:selenoprotein W-related protein